MLRSLTDPPLLERAVTPGGPPDCRAHDDRGDDARWSASLKEANHAPPPWPTMRFAFGVWQPYGARTTEERWPASAWPTAEAFHAQYVAACRARRSASWAPYRAPRRRRWWPRCCRARPRPLRTAAARGRGGGADGAAAEKTIPFASAQAHVLIGQPGFQRRDPDFLALLVGNHILGGGGFVSRLTQEVREKRGLSYSVYSTLRPGLHAGAFTVGLQTRPTRPPRAGLARSAGQLCGRRPHRGRTARRQRQP